MSSRIVDSNGTFPRREPSAPEMHSIVSDPLGDNQIRKPLWPCGGEMRQFHMRRVWRVNWPLCIGEFTGEQEGMMNKQYQNEYAEPNFLPPDLSRCSRPPHYQHAIFDSPPITYLYDPPTIYSSMTRTIYLNDYLKAH